MTGHRPVATGDYGTYSEIIAKIHSLCNFGCPYCYVYEMEDTSYLRNPVIMSKTTATAVAQAIADHALRFALPRIRVVLHGGEPLLAGIPFIRFFVGEIRRRVAEATAGATVVVMAMQTNGYLLGAKGVLDTLAELGIRIGVSLDGTKATHDQSRRTLPTKRNPQGLPTYDKIVRGIELMQARQPLLFQGVLCVINVDSDPVETHESLVSLGPPSIDYLWPLGTHDNPPPGLGVGGTPYADWLIAVWCRHLVMKYTPALPRIRYFDQLMLQLKYGFSSLEIIGLPVRGPLMIDTAGNYNHGDAAMSVADGLIAMRWRTTNLHLKSARLGRGVRMGVHNCSIHDANLTAMELNQRLGIKGSNLDGGPALCDTCMACRHRFNCGGGLYTHRWKQGSAYWNPSVYCDDLQKLVDFAGTVLTAANTLELIGQFDNQPYKLISHLLRSRLAQLT